MSENEMHFLFSYCPFYCDLQVKCFLKMSAGHPSLLDMTDECRLQHKFTHETFDIAKKKIFKCLSSKYESVVYFICLVSIWYNVCNILYSITYWLPLFLFSLALEGNVSIIL